MNSIEKNICNAIDIIVQKAVSEASYDKTIIGTIVKCTDETIGKYKVKYQNSTFYAFSGSSDITYSDGAAVYILVPNNDMTKEKTIIGTTKKLGTNYITTLSKEENYEINGSNCISTNTSIGISSYREEAFTKVLYHKDYANSKNLLKINKKSVNQYIKNSGNVLCGAKIRTNLPPEQQLRGNYGIIFALDFTDSNGDKTNTKYFTIDVNNMSGNPYKYQNAVRQIGIFEIESTNFVELNYIAVFCNDFPNSKPDSECVNDIFFSDFEFCGATQLSSEDLEGCSMTLSTPKGTFFDETSLSTDTLTIEAQVKVKGKIVDNSSQSISYYWFSQHAGITTSSQYYNKYGGQGWKCLNSYTTVKKATSTESAVVNWKPAKYQLKIKKSDVVAKEVKYKCVAIYDSTEIKKTVTIKNLDSEYDITIESDSGTEFYYDIGYPTLTCKIGGKEVTSTGYTYSWGVTNNSGTFESIASTTKKNKEYKEAKEEYEQLKADIENETKVTAAEKSKLTELKKLINSYNTITRVEKNNIYHLDVSTISNFSTYCCTVYYNDQYLGTASLTLTNSLTNGKGGYSLVINEGSKVFKYDENGVSPASSSLDSPIELSPLSFSLYDNLGNELEEKILKKCSIKWTVPSANTMISIPSSYTVSSIDEDNETKSYKNILSLQYTIADVYNQNKVKNRIKLSVKYKGTTFTAYTDFLFTKEGESGTNGSDFTCRIVPNIISGQNAPVYPIITENTDGSWSINYTTASKNKFFKVQLWNNEEKILDSVTTANTTEGKSAVVNWSILKNKYTSSVSDSTAFSVNASTGVFSYKGFKDSSPANIVKATVTYDGVTYYATMPIITVKLENKTTKATLKNYTGFRTATYTSDGKSPKYDSSNPFEITVKKKISGEWVDVSTFKSSKANSPIYEWSYLGRIYEDKKWVKDIHLGTNKTTGLAKNQKSVKPLSDFDGQCVTNAVECKVYFGSTSNAVAAKIHIPIHLVLNRYGNSAINGWAGNSVDINEDGGFILAPQMGAGQKEKDNSFTGVIMGKVKESGQSSADVGLIGYAKGQRSFFLDSKTGVATFGTNNKGQIIIDPSNDKAELYSGNYKKSDKNGAGLKIDLTTPEIRFGNGNFVVNSKGHMTAKGGGSVAGWTIGNNSLYKDKVGLSSKYTNDNSVAIWAGSTKKSNGTFRVTFGGHLYAATATIGSGSVNKITVGKSSGKTTHSALYSGKKSKFNSTNSGFYLGTDGIAIGAYNKDYKSCPFQVTSSGELIARTGYIGSSSNGWTIKSNALINGKETYNDTKNDGVYLGTYGIGLGKGKFYVSRTGKLHAEYGEIGGWTVTATRLENEKQNIYIGTSGIRFGDDFSISSSGRLSCTNAILEGKITATSGKIGGWTVSGTGLSNGSTYIKSNGAMGGTNWSITSGGKASFANISITGGSISIGGTAIDENGITLSSGNTLVGDTKLDDYIEKLAIGSLDVQNSLTFGGKSCEWQSIRVLSKRDVSYTLQDIDTYDISVSGSTLYFNSRTYSDVCTDYNSAVYYKDVYVLAAVGEETEGNG